MDSSREAHRSPFVRLFRRLRHDSGLSLRDFCLVFGFDASTLSEIERGIRPPPHGDQLNIYAMALGVVEYSEDWRNLRTLALEERTAHQKTLQEKYGFQTCPACGTEHTAVTMSCRDCGFKKHKQEQTKPPPETLNKNHAWHLHRPQVFDCGRYEIEIEDKSTGFSLMLHFANDEAVTHFLDDVKSISDRT